MPRDPLAWMPLLRHWTRCLGDSGEAISRLGDLSALHELDLAGLLPGGKLAPAAIDGGLLVKPVNPQDRRQLLAVLNDLSVS